MSLVKKPIREWRDVDPERFQNEIAPLYRPAVIRQYLKDWPALQAQNESVDALAQYIGRFDSGNNVVTYRGAPDIGGRFFYQDEMEGFNFDRVQETFAQALESILAHRDNPEPPSIYTGAVNLQDNLPGFARENHCDLVGSTAVARIWVGNAATVSTHYDLLDNIVCVVSGRRRFTLFPPEQLTNLYVGPLDFTLSGQPVSMVNLQNPDFDRFPRFKEALAAAEVAELEPGDALYLPKLWWHHVESLDPFNAIVNYWWDQTALGSDTAFTTLMHGLLTLRHLPMKEKQAWQAFFNHYLFRSETEATAHIPERKRGILGNMTPELYRKIKGHVLAMINR